MEDGRSWFSIWFTSILDPRSSILDPRFCQGRQVDDEFATPAGAVAVGLDPAAVHLQELAHQRQPDAQPALARSVLGFTWVNRSNTFGNISGGMPMPVSRTRITA